MAVEPFARGNRPTGWTTELVEEWTNDWTADQTREFRWRLKEELLAALSRDTTDHCAYCDRYLPYPKNVDHFRPKAQFPSDAYLWANLYLCCSEGCNYTRGAYSNEILAPDERGYQFDEFFLIDENFELQPLPGPKASRASKTIEYRQLNKPERSMGMKRRNAFREQSGRPRSERDFRFLWPEDNL